jgi:hypothetical protein
MRSLITCNRTHCACLWGSFWRHDRITPHAKEHPTLRVRLATAFLHVAMRLEPSTVPSASQQLTVNKAARSWRGQLQQLVALSSTEVECIVNASFLRQLLQHMGEKQLSHICISVDIISRILIAKGTIALSTSICASTALNDGTEQAADFSHNRHCSSCVAGLTPAILRFL